MKLEQRVRPQGCAAADRNAMVGDGNDLSFVTATTVDTQGNVVPNADNLFKCNLSSNAEIAGVDNGDPTSHASFKATNRKAFHGLALVVLRAKKKGTAKLTATADGLESTTIDIRMK